PPKRNKPYAILGPDRPGPPRPDPRRTPTPAKKGEFTRMAAPDRILFQNEPGILLKTHKAPTPFVAPSSICYTDHVGRTYPVGESPLFYWNESPLFYWNESRMTTRNATIAKLEQTAERVAQPQGIEIVEVELKGSGRNQLLRVTIDKPAGVTHADCEVVSKN